MLERMADTLLDPEIIREPAFEIMTGVVVIIFHREFIVLGLLLSFHGLYRQFRR
jgi:hypothetical protein